MFESMIHAVNVLPGGVSSASDLVRRIKDISPHGIAPFGLRTVKRMVGRGKKRVPTWEEKPSQEWGDLPLYLKSRHPGALGIDEIADALGTDQADLVEALRTITTARERERAIGAGAGERETERRAEAAAEVEAGEYMARRGKHPRLAALGVVGAHPHRISVWHEGPEGGGEWFRPLGRLTVGLAGRDNPGRGRRFLFHGAFGSKAAARARERETSGAFIRPMRYPGGMRYAVLTRRGNPLSREESAAVLRVSRAYMHDAHGAKPGSTAGAYNLGRADGLEWTARTFGEARRNPRGPSVHQDVSAIRTGLRAMAPKLKVRMSGGEKHGWIQVKGSLRRGQFSDQERVALRRAGLSPTGGVAMVSPERRPSVIAKLWKDNPGPRAHAGARGPRGRSEDMAKWLDNPYLAQYTANPRRRRHHGGGHHRRRRHNPAGGYAANRRRRHHRNPIAGPADALRSPMPFVTQAGVGFLGAWGTVVLGNYVGNMLLPTTYVGLDIMGKVARLGVRGGLGYVADMFLAKRMSPDNRTALRVGMAVGIGGAFVLDLLGSTFRLGAGDTAQTPGEILGTWGTTTAAGLTMGAYVRPHAIGGGNGMGAYVRPNVTGIHGLAAGASQRLYGR